MFRRLILTSFLVCMVSFPAVADNELPDSCGQDMYDLMKDEAWRHAQREVEMAERIILKPDSVMEYSCFDDYLAAVPSSAGVARYPSRIYGFQNYGARYAGGFMAEEDVPKMGTDTCGSMNKLWDYMKCQNFGSVDREDTSEYEEFDLFASFDYLENNKYRIKPVLCEDSSIRQSKWGQANSNTDRGTPISD